MRTLRTWLLLVLAVLLPLRGALAAGMLCPPAGSELAQVAAVAQGHHHGHDPAGVVHAHAGHAASGHDGAGGEAAHGADGKCNACSVLCCVPALPASTLAIGPAPRAEALFPPGPAPSPTFIAEGPERPPRSI